MLNKTGTWNDMKVQRSRIVCNAKDAEDTSETCCVCGSMLQCITEEVKKRTKQRICSRFTVCVHGIHDLALKNARRGRRCGKSAESQQHITAT